MNVIVSKKTVCIIYRYMPHYRYDFFCGLKEELLKHGISLNLVYGKYANDERRDVVDIDWGIAVKNRTFKIGNHQFVWIPTPRKIIAESDLIILMQENRILSNFPLLILSLFGRKKIALWGHGVNYQARHGSLGNRFKKLYAAKVDWWFAYTEQSAARIAAMGVPMEKISVVHNAINTRLLKEEASAIPKNEIEQLRRDLNLSRGPVGIYCGGMYKEKRIQFLVESCKKIHKNMEKFKMLFLGAGPDVRLVTDFCKSNSWAIYVGSKFGKDRIPYFKVSDIFLIPGAVGLAIMDCFSLQLPIITTQYRYHGPEIDYLISRYNGMIALDTVEDFANTAIAVLGDDGLRQELKKGCEESALKYTNENMIQRFSTGILQALA